MQYQIDIPHNDAELQHVKNISKTSKLNRMYLAKFQFKGLTVYQLLKAACRLYTHSAQAVIALAWSEFQKSIYQT